jgi:hypothetical protein
VNELETAIHSLETDARAAMDRARHHIDRADYHMNEANAQKLQASTCRAAIEAINRVRGVTTTEPEPVETPAEPEEVTAPAVSPFPLSPASCATHAYNGSRALVKKFDRDAVRREVLSRRIRYPLRASHRVRGNFLRQSLIAACVAHPDYQVYRDAGGFNLLSNTLLETHLDHAVDTLQIDRQKVYDDACVLHAHIYNSGEQGKDFV